MIFLTSPWLYEGISSFFGGEESLIDMTLVKIKLSVNIGGLLVSTIRLSPEAMMKSSSLKNSFLAFSGFL
jgi:hypothetical protein